MSDRRDSIRKRCIPDVYIFDAMALRNARWPFSDTQLSYEWSNGLLPHGSGRLRAPFFVKKSLHCIE
jgi:hypothetical protein